MSNCDSCPSKNSCNSKEQGCSVMIPKHANIKYIVGVISGKGGVGKSTITGILAVQLRKLGYNVGVLDGDITGPSMPRFFGINSKRSKISQVDNSEEVKFSPVQTSTGIKVMSLNLLTEEEEQPVIWRGPVITGVLKQMYGDTEWGELDYLLIDMPPGTGDVALTIMQEIPLTGVVIVSTPQDMVSMIVKKVVIMSQKMNVSIMGVIENMSYIKCNKCNEKIRIFSKKSAEEQAKYLEIPLLAELPINSDLTESMEKGEVEKYLYESQDYVTLLDNFKSKVND